MPKVKLNFSIHGSVSQVVEVPQAVIDEYNRQVDSDNPDCDALDRMLEQYVSYDDLLNQLDDPEDIELSVYKEAAPRAD